MQVRFEEINQQIQRIKKYAKQGLVSNYYNLLPERGEQICYYAWTSYAAVFVLNRNDGHYGYFFGSDLNEISSLLEQVPEQTMVEYISKNEDHYHAFLSSAGLKKKAVFKRLVYPNLQEIFDGSKNQYGDLLQRFSRQYEFQDRIIAEKEEADSIIQIFSKVFDQYTSHTPSKQELLALIEKKQVLIYKENERIRALHIYKLEGKKYYSYVSYNDGPFFMMYSLLARALKDAIKAGAVYGYCWVEERNQKSLRYCASKGFYPDGIKNMVYRKERT